ncbi:MAG: hypothetical protein KAU28_06135, partial [Phycisphaerae bacterium]|nr:hypothetical protein [Phycisphaerae bacterium]
QLVHGSPKTDVLFVLSPAEVSLFPAIVAHALGGADVAVLFATRPPDNGRTPPDQPLGTAAARTGAGGWAVLSDFTSQVIPAAAEALTEADIIKTWSRSLDIPAESELVRQIAAAIRQYRPAVLAVGPDGWGPKGRRAETRLVARSARRAAQLAGRKDALKELAAVGLEPWAVQRVFVGLEGNEKWQAPWEKPNPPDPKETTTLIDAAGFPQNAHSSIEMLAQDALWQMPWFALTDRPNRFTAYRCKTSKGLLPLLTTGLSKARLRLRHVDDGRRNLAAATNLRFAAARGTVATALEQLADAAKEYSDDPLAADRLLLGWFRLLEEGRLHQADQALNQFFQLGQKHPLYQQIGVLALATSASGEWTAQYRMQGPPQKDFRTAFPGAVKRFAALRPWSTTAAGRVLHAKALAATGRSAEALEILKKLASGPYEPHWRALARLELGERPSPGEVEHETTRAAAKFTGVRGNIDGRLNEPFWKAAPQAALKQASPRQSAPPVAGTFQAIRTRTHAIFAIRLPSDPAWTWQLEIAVDADRDTWTQLLLTCDTFGRRSAKLLTRLGPAVNLDTRGFLFRGHEAEGSYTFELALPLAAVGTDPKLNALWRLQVRARGKAPGRTATLQFQVQDDPRLLPELYGLLEIPLPRN